jgi:hypothetical protein
MITALVSFFGGSVFRMIWGEISAYVTAKQDHLFEIERMTLQSTIDAAQFERNQIAIKTQHDLGVDTIRVQSDADIGGIEAQGWLEAVKATAIKTGVAWVDAWNAMIRPGLATWSVVMITLSELALISELSDNTVAVTAAALGIFLADRSLMKRGK